MYSVGEIYLRLAEAINLSWQPAKGVSPTTYVERARAYFLNVAELRQSQPYAALGLVRALVTEAKLFRREKKTKQESEKLKEAKTKVGELVKQFPHLASAHYWKGRILELWNERRASLEEFRRATELDPQFSESYLAVAEAYERGL